MGLTDELEALRQSGSVKTKSADLLSSFSCASSSTSFVTPEAEAERRRHKDLQEKKSRLEAKIALHSNSYGGEDDLNSILLNKKLNEEQRRMKKEAERNLREWRRRHHHDSTVGGGGGSSKSKAAVSMAVGARPGGGADEDDDQDDEEARMNRDALEMLPEHVVRTLKAKYETNNAELALERALHEEEAKYGHGKGKALAKLLDISLQEEEEEDDEDDIVDEGVAEVEDEDEEKECPQHSVMKEEEEEEEEEAADEEWVKIKVQEKGEYVTKETESKECGKEESGSVGDKITVGVGAAVAAVAVTVVAAAAATKTSTTATTNPMIPRDDPEPEALDVEVEEVREKIEHLSIDEAVGGEEQGDLLATNDIDNDDAANTINCDNNLDAETKENPLSSDHDDTTTTSSKNYDTQIELTKRFYNLHSQEYIDHTSNQHNTAAASAATTTTTTTMDGNNLSSSSSSRRDVFIEYILQQQQQQLKDKSMNNDPTISNSTSTSLLLLDLGCGYGRDTYHFTSTLGHRVLGIDFSIEMLHHAKRLAPMAHYLNMDIRQLSNNPPLLVDQSLDGIWANSSLLHVPKCEIEGVLQGLYDAMKVGGVFFMSLKVKNDESSTADDDEDETFEIDERYTARNALHTASASSAPETKGGEDAHDHDGGGEDTRRKFYSYYTMEEVRELVIKSGWEILEMKEEDHRGMSDYITHSKLYLFATRRNK